MTDDNNNTLRAVFLAALMVLWVFAGTVAFAGGAAAVSEGDITNTDVDIDNPSTDAQTNYRVTTNFTGTRDPGSDNPSGVAAAEVDLSDASRFGGDTSDFDGRENVTVTIEDDRAGEYGEPQTREVPLQDTSADGSNISLDFQEKENVSDDATLRIQFEDQVIKNPSVEDTYDLELRSYTDRGTSGDFESDTTEYEITGDGDGGDADERPTDAEFEGNNATRWKGQILDFQARANCPTDDYQLRYYTPGDGSNRPYGTLIREITLNDSFGAQIPTRNVADDERVVIVANDSNDNRAIVDVEDGEQTAQCTDPSGSDDWVEVVPQEFNTSFEEDAVRSGGNATLDVESNRDDYDLYVTSDDFSASELSDIVEGAETNGVNSDRAPDDDAVRVNGTNSSDELDFDFGGVDTGNYTFTLSPVDTLPEDESSIEITEEVPGDAEFDSESGAYTVRRGDIQSPEGNSDATISVDTQGDIENVVLVIGDEDRNNYQTQVVVSPDDNGNADIRMNTFLAGQVDEKNESEAYTDLNGEIIDVNRQSPKLTGVLDEGQYDVILEDTNGAEFDRGVVNIAPSSYEDLTQLRHPDAPLGAADETGEVANNSDFSETNTVTLADRDRGDERDLLIHRVNISGIYGAFTALASADDLESANGNDVLAASQNDDPDLDVATNDPILDVRLTQRNFVQNTEPKVQNYDDPSDTGQFRFVIDEDNETVYLVTDVRDLELDREVGGQDDPEEVQIEPGDDFRFRFDIGPGFNQTYRGGIDTYVPEGNTTAQLDTEDREATLGNPNADRVRVEAKSNQTISGQTNIAPGSEVSIAVDSSSRIRRANDTDTSDLAPVFQRATATVQEDGSFRASTFDFSDNEVGRNFSVTAQNQGFENSAEKPGVVLGPANVSIEGDITVPTDQNELASVTVDSVYLPDGGFVTIHDGSVNDDVFGSIRGTSGYLEGDTVHENVVVVLDDPYTEDGEIIAMAHKDTNNNETYDFVTSEGAEDGPYTDGGEPVIAQASVTFEEETPTPTAEPTDEPTETATEEPTETETPSEDQPGFGAVLALIALIGAALLAARRNDF